MGLKSLVRGRGRHLARRGLSDLSEGDLHRLPATELDVNEILCQGLEMLFSVLEHPLERSLTTENPMWGNLIDGLTSPWNLAV
jgi:hypothetical protein